MLGTLALSFASALKLALQIAVLPVLARILGPSAVGLVALAMPIVLLATMISSGGLGDALVRKADSSRELESTVFWLSCVTALLLAALVSGLSLPASRLMAAPKLAPIIVALSSILVLSGSLTVVNARIARERRFSVFAAVETIASIVSSAAAIGAAIAGAGAWSLVLQQLVLWTIKLCLLWPASGFRPQFLCRPSLAWPYLGFGLNLVGANLADFGSKNFSTLMIGSLVGVAAAGHYAMAYQIVRVPEMIISGPLYLSMFVSVARWGDDSVGAQPLALRGLRGAVTLLAPLFCGMALVAHPAVAVLLGPAWTPTGGILMCLAPAGFFLCAYSFIGAILLGLGRSDHQFRLILLCGCFLAAGSVTGASWGVTGVAAGLSGGAALAAPFYLHRLTKQLGISIGMIVREIFAPLAATLVMALAVLAAGARLPHNQPVLELSMLVLCGGVSFALALAALCGRRLRQDLHWVLGRMPHEDAAALTEEPLA